MRMKPTKTLKMKSTPLTADTTSRGDKDKDYALFDDRLKLGTLVPWYV